MGVYNAVAYVMRYWFILVIVAVLVTLIWASVSELRQRKNVMGEVGKYIGYLEIISGSKNSIGVRIGMMDENMVGSSRSADIIINHPSVKRTHAMLYKKDNALILTPLQKGHTLINGRRATRAHQLNSGDVISFGDVQAEVFLKKRDLLEEEYN